MPKSDLENPLLFSDYDEEIHGRHDFSRAQTSDRGLQIMWWVYSMSLLVFSVVITVVFFGILLNRKVRRNPFHKYILFLCFPDFVYSFCCAITCLLGALNRSYHSWGMCRFQAFYLIFGTSANSCLNACMAWEVYRLLRSSHIRKKYYPPTDAQVYRNSFLSFAIAIFTAAVPLISDAANLEEYLPSSGIQAGFTCIVADTTPKASFGFWFLIVPLAFGIQYIFVTYVFLDVVCWSKLLPPKGIRRELSIYFFRIAAMFAFLWAPTFIFFFALKGIASPWAVWGSGLFSHTQGMVSAVLVLYKKDIREAVWDFVKSPWRLVCPCWCKTGGLKQSSSGDKDDGRSPSSTARISEDLGLPVQGANFEFRDETGASMFSEDQDNDEEQAKMESALEVQDSKSGKSWARVNMAGTETLQAGTSDS